MNNVHDILSKKQLLAVLLDPENLQTPEAIDRIGQELRLHRPDMVLIGGSTWYADTTPLIRALRAYTGDKGTAASLPLILFPGHPSQFSGEADAILFHSLLSGNNPDTLIGWQTMAAQRVRKSGIAVLPMGYILVDGGRQSTTARVTGTQAIPLSQQERIVDTALAGELLGMRNIYLEAGSGAAQPVQTHIIRAVREATTATLWVGGGIRSRQDAEAAWQAGANVVVVGNWLEQHPEELGNILQSGTSGTSGISGTPGKAGKAGIPGKTTETSKHNKYALPS